MASAVAYKLRVMELHSILARIDDNMVRYALQICFHTAAGYQVAR